MALLHVPSGWTLELPVGVTVKRQARGRANVVLAFFVRELALQQQLDALSPMIFPSGGMWIAWPKKGSGRKSDLTDKVVRQIVLERGLVDNKVCAVDETWSALRFVWRRASTGRIGAPVRKRDTINPCEFIAISPSSISRALPP